jgi:hypothetical protein
MMEYAGKPDVENVFDEHASECDDHIRATVKVA